MLAGDLTESEARSLATEAFGKWSGTGGESPQPPPGSPTAERVLIVDKPSSPQTMLLLAQPGVMRSDPDFERLNVMNQVLGGLFSSRINLNLREKHGYTYGAGSLVWETRGVGPITISASVRADVTGPSIQEVLTEVEGMAERGVTEEELELAKESVARSLPALFMTSSSTVGTIGQLYEFGMAPDYYEGLPARLDAITTKEVQEVARNHLKPASLRVIAVGDRRSIEPQIASLKLRPVGFRNADGQVLGVMQAASP